MWVLKKTPKSDVKRAGLREPRPQWSRLVRRALPYFLLVIISSPILLGYSWLLLSTFAKSTRGLRPVGGWTLENWRFLVEKQDLRASIWLVTFNTLGVALGLAVLVVGVSAMAGYALSRLQFPGRRSMLGITLILHSFPTITLLIGIFFVLRNLGLYNTLTGVIFVQVAFELPLGIWLMKGFFDGVSWDMERAALIDGASRLRAWWDVVLPQVRPGIAALSIFSFISGWGAFLIPYTFTSEETRATIAVYLNNLMGNARFVNYGEVAAVGLFQLIPVILFFLFTQKYLMHIFAGGSKGGS